MRPDDSTPYLLCPPSLVETLAATLGVTAEPWTEKRNGSEVVRILREARNRDISIIESGVPHDPDGYAVWLATALTRARYRRFLETRRDGDSRVILAGFTAGAGTTSTVNGETDVYWGVRVAQRGT